MRLNWKWLSFSEMTATDLYRVLKARQDVFVVEQKCFYLDADEKDFKAWHLIGESAPSGEIAAYLRVLPPGLAFTEHSLGRVLTTPPFRGKGIGRLLMNEGLRLFETKIGAAPIRIAAQAYLEDFYSEFGFAKVAEPYLLDGISHLDMLRRSTADTPTDAF
jgi:ElaA protein